MAYESCELVLNGITPVLGVNSQRRDGCKEMMYEEERAQVQVPEPP